MNRKLVAITGALMLSLGACIGILQTAIGGEKTMGNQGYIDTFDEV